MMNNENKKGLLKLTIILSVLVVLLSGYLIYDKVLNDKKTNDVNDMLDNDEENKLNNHDLFRYVQVLNSKVGSFIIDKKRDVYYIPNHSGTWNADYVLKFDDVDKEKLGFFGTYVIEGYDSNIYNDIENEGFEGYKLNLSAINYAYEVIFTEQYANTSIIFIGTNGKISELFFMNAGINSSTTITLKNEIEGYENIEYLVEHYDKNTNSALLFDKNGIGHIYHGAM